jgi:hypothetical protein
MSSENDAQAWNVSEARGGFHGSSNRHKRKPTSGPVGGGRTGHACGRPLFH